MRRRLLPLAVVAVLAAAVVAAEALSGTHDASAQRGAPALPARVLVAPRVSVADLRGKPAIVHFWASWCGPCTTEAGELARLPAALRGRAALVGVDWSDSHSGAEAFVRRHDWRFPRPGRRRRTHDDALARQGPADDLRARRPRPHRPPAHRSADGPGPARRPSELMRPGGRSAVGDRHQP